MPIEIPKEKREELSMRARIFMLRNEGIDSLNAIFPEGVPMKAFEGGAGALYCIVDKLRQDGAAGDTTKKDFQDISELPKQIGAAQSEEDRMIYTYMFYTRAANMSGVLQSQKRR